MSTHGRVLDVTAHTTLDFVETTAEAADWTESGIAVVDVSDESTDPDSSGDGVRLSVEMDPTSCERVEPHADRLCLTREQAQTLADALGEAAATDGPAREGGRDDR